MLHEKPTKNIKYGLIISDNVGSVGYKGGKYNAKNCNVNTPLIIDNENDLKTLLSSGHFTEIELK